MRSLQHILPRLGSALIAAAALCAASIPAACTSDDGVSGERFLYIEGGLYDFDLGSDGNVGKNANGEWNSLETAFYNGGGERLCLRSNMGAWRIEPLYAEDSEWVDLWPDHGTDDGRFYLAVDRNLTAYSRVATLNIIAEGRIVQTILVKQKPGTPSIQIDMDGLTSFTLPTKGASRTIRIASNIGWKPVAEDDAGSWISFANQTENSVDVIVSENPDEDVRTGKVSFVMVGTGNEGVKADIEIKQKGQRSSFDRATKRSIADVLAELGPDGSISGNVYVEASVVSDPLTLNFDPAYISYSTNLIPTLNNRLMWVQDDSGRGLLVEFLDAAYNTYLFNDKLKLHLVDQRVITDEKLGTRKISGVTSDEIPGNEPGTGVEPLRLADLSSLDNYENTLVRIENVEFAVPMGTYVNIDERQYAKSSDKGLRDSPRQYAHLLRDAAGNTVPLYSTSSFTEKFSRLIPRGSGSVTAIVTKNIVAGKTQTVLRLRRNADNAVSDDASTRLTRTVVEFGPFTTFGTLQQINATTGTGTLKTSIFKQIVNAAEYSGSSSTSDYMYWSWTYARRTTATLDADHAATPALTGSITENPREYEMQYPCLNCNTWWQGNGSSIRDADGEAWIATISTEGVTGDLDLCFTTASSSGGPRDFVLEWALTEDAPAAEWQPIAEYTSGNWDANYQLKQQTFRLPVAMKGHRSVVIRHRVTANIRANDAANITTGGTNRMGYWAVSEVK